MNGLATTCRHGVAPASWLALAGIALLAGWGIYVGREAALPEARFAAWWTGSAPSGLHAFAFALSSAAFLSTRRARLVACGAWGAVNLLFEAGQHAALAPALAQAFYAVRAAPLARYFRLGTFDELDLLAVAVGAALACAVVLGTVPRARAKVSKELHHA